MSETTEGTRVIAATVAALPGSARERFADRVAARRKVDGEWTEITYGEVGDTINEIALGLVDLGIEPGDRVGILADTRLEWTLASYGISAAGGVVVPIYPTNSPHECQWVAGNSEAKAVVVENEGQAAKIKEIRGELPSLEHLIGMEPGIGDVSLEDLRARGRDGDAAELESRQSAIEPDDPYTIVYTSGTTGPPKGSVLTHHNAMTVCDIVEKLEFVQPGEVTYLYLPLAHVFALLAQLASFDQGTAIVYLGGDTKQILAEIIETKPTYLPSVPRIFEKLYAAAMKLQEQASEEDRERFQKAIKVGVEVRRRQQRGEPVPDELKGPFEQADKEIFSRVRDLFGGQIRQAVTGAAPIAPEILEFFYAAGVPVLEGWGMTETTGVGTVGTLEDFKFGTVGKPLPGVELKISDEDGEILMKGPNVFKEYWRNPDATAETFDEDGWLKTGDLGSIDDDGFLKITGRKKDIIITAGGKNLTPANLENDLKRSRWISQAVMHGDRRPFPVALITLDPEEIVHFAREHGLPEDVAALSREPQVHALIQGELDAVNARYARVEQIKKFFILDHDFSQETGELTPTLKVKRNVVNDRYAGDFAALYAS
jgi:long-chain acyl-CoA synthetase